MGGENFAEHMTLFLNNDTLVWEFSAGRKLVGLRTHSVTTVTPVAGSFAATFVLWHGRHLCARSSIHARLAVADVTRATLQRILTLFPCGVAKLRFAAKRTSALTIIYPTSVLRLVQIAAARRPDKNSH